MTIRWPVFRVDKTPIDESAGKQLCDVKRCALIAMTPFDTTALAKDFFYQRATIKLLIFTALLLSMKNATI